MRVVRPSLVSLNGRLVWLPCSWCHIWSTIPPLLLWLADLYPTQLWTHSGQWSQCYACTVSTLALPCIKRYPFFGGFVLLQRWSKWFVAIVRPQAIILSPHVSSELKVQASGIEQTAKAQCMTCHFWAWRPKFHAMHNMAAQHVLSLDFASVFSAPWLPLWMSTETGFHDEVLAWQVLDDELIIDPLR